MKKINYTTKSLLDGKEILGPVATDNKYILLSYFVAHTYFIIDKTISDLESVASGEKTFEEIMEGYAPWTFGNDSGELVYNKDTAKFISLDSMYPDIEMPLQELIDILYEWKTYIESES